MTTSTVLLAATEYTALVHEVLFLVALAAFILPLWLGCHLVERNNKERQKRHEARLAADERFHTLLYELNRREAETRAQKIEFVMKQQQATTTPPPATAVRRRFLPLNPQQGCVS